MMTGEETAEQDELEAQFQTATEGLQRVVSTRGKSPGMQVGISPLAQPQTRHFRGFRTANLPAIRKFARTFAPRTVVMRLFQDKDIHPHVMVLALARVTGEVGAGTALASEQDPEELLGDLAEAMRQAMREFQEMLEAEALPTAGNA